MEQRLSLVTLGVADLARSRRFYEQGLGWRVSPASVDDVVFIQLGGIVLSLFPHDRLAEDAQVPPGDAPVGFRGVALAHNTRSAEEVDQALDRAAAAGAVILKSARKVFWGGYAGYFADPDGHVWEVAWNPFWEMDENGAIKLP